MQDDANSFASLGILIVDDDANIRKTMAYCLAKEGHTVIAVSNAADGLDEARRHGFDLAFVDLKLGEDDGMQLLPELLAASPWMKIVVITAHASIERAVEAMRRGATDFIAKPFTPEQLRLLVRRMGAVRALETELASLKEDVQRLGPEERLQSRNPAMQHVLDTARKAAASTAVVLLQGESGTGKTALARAMHHWSPRAGRPMAVVACPAVPAELLESELFGHVKGAFTGAVKDAPGRIAACEGGTLLLDEVADMAPAVQAKLLRFIQDKEYERLGDATPRKADVRILAATNADLQQRVAEGRFREDLFYRLNVITLTVPPLRQRPEDILPLARGFLAHFCRTNHKQLVAFSPEAEAALAGHSWPGNVRELRNAVERAVILGSGDGIQRRDLPEALAPATGKAGTSPAIGDAITLAVLEELHIRRVLAKAASLQEAADILDIDQATLWRRRKLYGV